MLEGIRWDVDKACEEGIEDEVSLDEKVQQVETVRLVDDALGNRVQADEAHAVEFDWILVGDKWLNQVDGVYIQGINRFNEEDAMDQ